MQRVYLVGLDFGTTTSSAIVASASVRRNSANARMELSDVQECFRSDMVFTPYRQDRLDLERLEQYLDAWLGQGGVSLKDVFGGGALLTGLAAQACNAGDMVALIRQRLGDALIASADDPLLESWLAFMGSCAGLSQAHPRQLFLNLDIGGGTTNLAWGLDGEVLATDCRFIGARHIQVVPGTYRITSISRYGQAMLDELALRARAGDELAGEDLGRIVDFYLKRLEAAVPGGGRLQTGPHLAMTLSGGVGELVYRHLRGEPWPSITAFGDLGIDLAQGLAGAPFWREHWRRFQPAAGGRATVYGLLRHSTHVSGSTIFLPHPADLPLRDLPILGSMADDSSPAQLAEQLRLAAHSGRGAGFRLLLNDVTTASIRTFAERLRTALQTAAFPAHVPLVLFVGQNVGKVLGQYVTAWGASPWHVMVIDEISCQNAQYAHIGALRDQVIPVSFFGINASIVSE